mmetsp:Transcript_19618/g.30231  ORF Transcript_19618/g.30231 Transcript_19618/m.30231 type:complete len:245 (-) Transcript_19618:1253-1987(-)
MLTRQEEGIDHDEHDDQSLEQLGLAHVLHLVAELHKPLRLLAVQAPFLLLFGLLARTRRPSAAWRVLGVVIVVLGLVFVEHLLFGHVLLVILFFLLLLELKLSLSFKLLLYLLLPSGLLVEGLVEVGGLDCDHQVEDDEGAEDDAADKEEVVGLRVGHVSYDVHHVGPPLERDDLEDIHDRQQNVVERVSIGNRIFTLDAADIVFWNPIGKVHFNKVALAALVVGRHAPDLSYAGLLRRHDKLG